MSKQNIKLFFKKVSNDVQLQDQIQQLIDEYNHNFETKFIELGHESGYEFSREDIKAVTEKFKTTEVEVRSY